MDLSRFPFHLLSNFETCLILVHFSLLISSLPANTSETQIMVNLQEFGSINQSSSEKVSFIGQKKDQKAMKEFHGFFETPEKGRQKREVATEAPDLCQDASIDAATTTADGKIYVFKGDYYWELTGEEKTSIVDGYPRKISEDWEGVPGNLDAALFWPDGRTYFFKESDFWKFSNKTADSGFPKKITNGFEGIPNSVDAALFDTKSWKTYFFKGSECYQYNGPNKSPRSISYPLANSTWQGLPNNIDAALQKSNKETYFFKEKSFYRYDGRLRSVAKDDPADPYPRTTAVWWFGCREQSTSNEDLSTVSLNGADTHPNNIHNISSSTHSHMEEDDGDDSTTSSYWNELLETNSAVTFCASLLLSFLMVAILWTY